MSARSSIIVDIESGVPLARLVPLTAAVGESECEFWRRKALERSHKITALNRQLLNLRDALDEVTAENERLEAEVRS